MTLEDAVAAERREDLKLAADIYENRLAEGNGSLDVILNLALLYWQVLDPGLQAAARWGPDFFDRADRRYLELLAEAERQYPNSTEARFWRRYIRGISLGEPFDMEECRELLREDPTVLVPAMYLFSGGAGQEAVTEALALLERCKAEGTMRADYVASVIEGVLTRMGRRR